MTETVKLDYPINVDGEEIAQVTLRRPTFGDIELFEKEKTDLGKTVKMMTLLAGLSPEAVRKLDVEDFGRIGEAVGKFFPKEEEA